MLIFFEAWEKKSTFVRFFTQLEAHRAFAGAAKTSSEVAITLVFGRLTKTEKKSSEESCLHVYVAISHFYAKYARNRNNEKKSSNKKKTRSQWKHLKVAFFFGDNRCPVTSTSWLFFGHWPKCLWNDRIKLSPFGQNVWKCRLKNTVTTSFDTTLRQMTKTSQRKRNRPSELSLYPKQVKPKNPNALLCEIHYLLHFKLVIFKNDHVRLLSTKIHYRAFSHYFGTFRSWQEM